LNQPTTNTVSNRFEDAALNRRGIFLLSVSRTSMLTGSKNRRRQFIADESKLILYPTVKLSVEKRRALRENS
jgi:hypothetical protein